MGRNRDNNDDFQFDDLFGDEDENKQQNGGFDDDGFGFDDDDFDSTADFEDLDSDVTFDDPEEAGTQRGPNRTFIILAVAMILLFVIGLGAVLFLALREPVTPPDQLTAIAQATAISADNFATLTAFAATQTQQATDAAATQTQSALDMVATQTADALGLTATAEAFLGTQTAEADFQTQTAIAANVTPTLSDADRTATQVFLNLLASPTPEPTVPSEVEPFDPSPTVTVGGGALNSTSVALTATALFNFFLNTPTPIVATQPGGGPIPGGGGGGGESGEPEIEMPDSGLFDDVSGGRGVGAIMLIAVGLIGVIFGARRLRTLNAKA